MWKFSHTDFTHGTPTKPVDRAAFLAAPAIAFCYFLAWAFGIRFRWEFYSSKKSGQE
jgi:hypothetical protein